MEGQPQAISRQAHHPSLRNWCIGLALTVIAVITSYLWFDQRIAFFVHRNVSDKTIFIWLQRLPAAFFFLASIVLVWCGFWALIGRRFSHVQLVSLACSISFISSAYIVSQLKYVFGRTWPLTWVDNNPSLIQNGVFGFNPFHGGIGFAAFPSGHAAGVSSVMAVLWWSYPNWRPIYVACVSAVAIGLIGSNFHFLSDIVGGMFVGISAGYIATKMMAPKMGFLHER